MNYSLNQLYKVVGISKQAVYRHSVRKHLHEGDVAQLMLEADELRSDHPGCGVEKMYYALNPDFMGRDKFVNTFMELGYGLRRKRNYRRTTFASQVYYPNLIKGMTVSSANTIWQSDITYIEVNQKFYYAVFIIDVYTKEIVGYCISEHLRATANIEALKMAVSKYGYPVIHHSDRGSQYIYKKYIELLQNNNTQISMALSAQDNAYAERINGTIKQEYLDYWQPGSFLMLKKMLKKAVKHYNTQRPHNHLKRMSPDEFKKQLLTLNQHDRPKVKIYTEEPINHIS